MFYLYKQNNSGGRFDKNDKVAEYVIIESISSNLAKEFMEYLTIDQSPSCPCCGERWYPGLADDELILPSTKSPFIYTHYKDYEQRYKQHYGEFETIENPSVKTTSWGSKIFKGSIKLNTIEEYAKYIVNNDDFTPSVIIYYLNGDKKIISKTTVN